MAGLTEWHILPKDTQVLINGEKGNFYRVYLNSKLTGWIAKSDIEQSNTEPQKTILKDFKIKEDKDYCKYEFELNQKSPFTLKEENGLTLQFFNVESRLGLLAQQHSFMSSVT